MFTCSHKLNSDVHMIFCCPGKMLTELLNDPKYNKNLKKLLICLLGGSDIVTVESMCQRNKLCTKAISLVPLHGLRTRLYYPIKSIL